MAAGKRSRSRSIVRFRNGIAGSGTTYHESGTLWMGDSPASSVTNTLGRFHHVTQRLCLRSVSVPDSGSVNPVLTGLTLARRIAAHVAA